LHLLDDTHVSPRRCALHPNQPRRPVSVVGLLHDPRRPSVLARLASQIHLRPLRLAAWTLASSARPPSGRLPFPRYFRPWSCPHPRGPRPLPCPFVQVGPKTVPSSRTSSPEVRRPSNAPSPENPLPGARHPDRPSPGCPCCARLVAGFHPRFGPPSPFLTTLTVCASPKEHAAQSTPVARNPMHPR
jgi:hypothetical protein